VFGILVLGLRLGMLKLSGEVVGEGRLKNFFFLSSFVGWNTHSL
jgi:hypothetical protein